MKGVSAVVLALVVVALLLAPTRAQYGSTCSSSADCTDVAYPHCSIYWMDQTLGANTESYSDPAPKPSPAQVKGVCVQCRTDCDCAVNQYCGAGDISIAAEISRNSGTAGQTTETDYKRLMKEMELYGTAFQGLKIRSRCLDYAMPQEHCSAHVKDTLSTLVVEQKNEDGKTRPVYRAAPGKLSQPLAARFCGKVNTWAPPFFTCLVSGGLSQDISRCAQGPTDSDLSTEAFADTASVCPKWAGYRESSIGEVFVSPPCGEGDAVMGGGGYSFVSPAIDWEGVCVHGSCQICLDGTRRCTEAADAGIPQICLGGGWKPLRGNGMLAMDLSWREVPYSVSAQALVTVAVFVAISFAMLVLNVSGVWLSYRKAEEERESKRFEKAMNDLRGIKSEGQGSNRVSPEPIDSGWGEPEGGSPRKERVRDNAML